MGAPTRSDRYRRLARRERAARAPAARASAARPPARPPAPDGVTAPPVPGSPGRTGAGVIATWVCTAGGMGVPWATAVWMATAV